jgi:hypothetical protein
VRPLRSILLRALACALLILAYGGWAPAAHAQAGSTSSTLHEEITGLINRTANQWAGMLTPSGVFQNPFPADVARGHHSFVPPMLAYAIHRAGRRTGSSTLIGAAEKAWPQAVSASRASAFDMVGAAYAFRDLSLSDARRDQLSLYMSVYGIPPTGYSCLVKPGCYGNLKLVDALAVLSITGVGIRSPDPAARLHNRRAARRRAARLINRRIGRIVDHRLRARSAGRRVRGSYLSDPKMNPIAYHALSAFMLAEAVRELGGKASRSARRASRETLKALAVLVAPDGDISYLGRGQAQNWVPAVVAGALASGARDAAVRKPRLARIYLAAARRAVQRLATQHGSDQGLQLVPGAIFRTTANGIDGYAHTVAYNGLALFALTVAQDALAAMPAVRIGRLPAEHRLAVRDSRTSGLGIVADGRGWLAVHRKAIVNDARFDFGALALKRWNGQGWVDLLAPRPYAPLRGNSGGPSLIRHGRFLKGGGDAITVRRRTVTVDGGYKRKDRWVRRVRFRWRLTATGARLVVSGARRGDRFRMLAYTPAGTGVIVPDGLVTANARWVFSRPISGGRLPGYHSAPVENLDALEARVTAPKSGRFTVTIGI